MGIRICPDCGGKVSDSRRDCIHCGYVFPVTKQCPDCGGNIEENAKVCPECGYAFEVEQTTGVVVSNVAPTVQTNKSTVERTSKLDETTSVVCPQCGSNDIELKSSELGKCRACGTTVVLPKKEQQVNVVNNFVVNNNAENFAQYYTIKRERTLNDEFIREAYVAMTQDRKTPIDISDGEFALVKESNEQYIEVDSTANITYSATVGYDYKVTYTDYDSQGKPVQRTKTETEWKPFSGSHVTQSTVYVGNDDNSKRASAFGRAVNHAEPGSIMPYDGTDTTEAAPLTPNPASIERAKQNAIFEAESEAERSLPGDRYKDFNASGSATVNSVKSYSAPTQDAVFKYKEEEHFCTAFAFGPFMLGGTSPDDSDSIHQVVKEKTNPLFITSLSLLGVLIALIVVAFTCPVGFNGALLSILVPACVMLAMLIASIAVTKSLYTKLINKQQQVKVERTDEKLSELKLAPMTDAEKTTATSKAGESSLTHKKNPLRIATIALCIIFFIGSIVSVFVANNLNIEGYFDNFYGNSVVCLHSYDHDCDTTCNDCGATRTTSTAHSDVNPADNSCDNCGASVSTLTFTLSDDGQSYAITDANSNISSDITIPSTYNGKPVTTIGYWVFYGCTSLTSIVIPDSVTTIEWYAFYDCTSLTSVTFGENSKLTTIGYMTFYNCTSLTSIVIPDSVTTIGEGAFAICTSLTSVTFGENSQLTTFGESAFSGCSRLTSITIPDTVTSIGGYAFYGCSKLQNIYITDIVAWCNISGLDNLMNYGSSDKELYINNELVTSVTIPDGVTSIPSYAFSCCTGLTSVTIGGSVTSIGSYAFEDCIRLVEVYNKSSRNIVAGNTSCGYVAYYALNVYTEEGGSKLSTDEDGFIIYTDGDDKILVGYVGEQTDLIIPDGIKEIYKNAFIYCDGLTSIVIPDSVTSISSHAFEFCSGLTSVTIGDSVTSIGSSAFRNCTSLTSISVDENNPNYKSIDGNLYSKDGKTLIQYAIGKTATSFVIPDSVNSIGADAFYYCTSLTSVTSGENSQLTTIDYCAFWGCSSLTSIVIPDSVTTIRPSAFWGCSSLTSVTFGENSKLTTIGHSAFWGCTSLTSVTIPDSVTTIESSAFSGCYKLVEVYNKSSLDIVAGNSDYGYVAYYALVVYTTDEPSKVSTDGDGYIIYTNGADKILVGYVGEQTDLIIPNGIKEINKYAFCKCRSLTSITIPDSVTSIGDGAFRYCASLTSVTIPDSVTTIGEYAFDECYILTDVYYTGTKEQWKAISIDSDNSSLTNATIHYNYVADEN